MCYRAYDGHGDHHWPLTARIATYSGGNKIRDVKLIDPETHENPLNPHLSQNHYMTHFPKDKICPVCAKCKTQKRQARKKSKDDASYESWVEPKTFAELVTADNMIVAESKAENRSRNEDKYAIVIQDWATKQIGAFPVKSKSGEDSLAAFQYFLGPGVKPKLIYSDNSGELSKAAVQLGCPHDTCTPHVPQTNGIAENCVRQVKEGTSCLLLQSGLSRKFWDDAMRCCCFSRAITDILACGCTSYQLRFGELTGHRVPFGALVEYMPMRDGKALRDHPLGSKTRPGIFYGVSCAKWWSMV